MFAEGVMALLLLVKIRPLRELVMKGLDQVNMYAIVFSLSLSLPLFFSLSLNSTGKSDTDSF